jgi:hypothetical protein
MAISAQSVIEQWLYSTLSGDSTLSALVGGRFYSSEVSQDDDTAYPCVLFSYYTGNDVLGMNASRHYSECVYKVVVIGLDQPFSALEAAYARADLLLHRQAAITVPGAGSIIHSYRSQPYQITETAPGGKQYRSLGGLYVIAAQPS